MIFKAIVLILLRAFIIIMIINIIMVLMALIIINMVILMIRGCWCARTDPGLAAKLTSHQSTRCPANPSLYLERHHHHLLEHHHHHYHHLQYHHHHPRGDLIPTNR